MFNLLSLPYEVLSNIIANINFDDVFNLGLSCKALKYLLTEESICRLIVQNKIPFCNEALSNKYTAGLSASALRRVAKRREAFATANPYSVATIGFGDAYLYCKGVLCYTLDDQLRVLNLHDSACREAVVSIPGMLRSAISENACNTKGVFQLLYCSDSIISCVYKTSGLDANSWLIAFSIETSEVLVVRELDSVERLFVRHDAQYLYYGTHSELGSDNHKKWIIRGYNLTKREWFDQKVRLSDMVGSEIGSTVCFEFDNGYFYALSNQTSFEVEEIDWTSFYHCIRFPLASPCEELTEKTKNHSMWRRQHEEGPIDDRWTNLRLDTDENTGELRIIESRKEWYHGASRSQRTYYTTPIVFPSTFYDTDDDLYFAADASFSSVATAACSVISAGSSSSTNTQSSTSEDCSSYASRDLSAYPDDPLLRLLRKDDNPNYMPSQKRLPQFIHPGHDGSTNQTFTLAKSRLRYYDSSSSTFLDVVDDPLPTDWQENQRLRLRVGSRTIGPPLVHPPDHPSKAGLLCSPTDVEDALSQMYKQSDITYWPPAQDPEVANESLDELYKLLNPPSHLGNVEGTADERSLVYVTGGYGSPQAIIFVSFDPAIKLAGLKRWGGMTRKGVGEGPHIDGRANGHTFDVSAQVEDTGLRDPQMMCGDIMESDVTIGIVRKGKGKETETEAEKCSHKTATAGAADASGHTYFNTHETPDSSTAKASWMWHEKAMYQDIGLGYYFGKDRKPAVVNGGEKGRHTLFTS
ncbi:hypothetical protein BCIN_14g02740 [Botrytis cinerea B05.10]|uniref:F-box domain-containing protein n=2 Tax=Botryotinia fuckeliana TaxID=40559 RepID=A0A384K2V2_BOTFB|nr:hypothetical protein BCIN_14g02740 [Botrytis cinerea B05.10]ATZ57101.1 hypothetical protein BCIN_14g02740 [Botrytis cinerea B05.10]